MNANKPKDHAKESKTGGGMLAFLPKTIRGHVVAVLGELIGTLSFIFIAFAGTQTANVSSNTNTGTTVITTTVQKTPDQLLYISLSFGFSLAVNAWVFFRVSGGLFNPAVTLGMVLIGAITIVRGILLFIAQMAGAIAGAYIVQALFTGGLNVDTTLSATTSIAQGVLIEMMATTLLVFTIFMLAAEKHIGSFIAPVGIGLALFVSELVAVFWTGGSLNPARSFAPAVVTSFHGTQWVYWVGPICGSLLAVIIYKIIKALEYETVNPDPESMAPAGPAGDPRAVKEQKQNEKRASGYDDYSDEQGRMDTDSSDLEAQTSTRNDVAVRGTPPASSGNVDRVPSTYAPVTDAYRPASSVPATGSTRANGNAAPATAIPGYSLPAEWRTNDNRNVESYRPRTTPLPDLNARGGSLLRTLR